MTAKKSKLFNAVVDSIGEGIATIEASDISFCVPTKLLPSEISEGQHLACTFEAIPDGESKARLDAENLLRKLSAPEENDDDDLSL